jgi:hypothetical protein
MINRYEVNYNGKMADFYYSKKKAISFSIQLASQTKGNLYQTVVINKYRWGKYLGCYICIKSRKIRNSFTFEYQKK